jgi:hypothetical protein
MALSVGFRIPVSLLILLPKLRGSDSYPGGTVSHRTRQPSLDAQRPLPGSQSVQVNGVSWPILLKNSTARIERTANADLFSRRLHEIRLRADISLESNSREPSVRR